MPVRTKRHRDDGVGVSGELAKRMGRVGSVTFHSRTVWSALPVARVCPSGLNATETTAGRCPISWPSGMGWAGSVTFHSRTVLSALPVARVCPSGANATDKTGGVLR